MSPSGIYPRIKGNTWVRGIQKNNIKELAAERGITAYELGKKFKKHHKWAYEVVENRVQPCKAILARLCILFDVEPQEIIECDYQSIRAEVERQKKIWKP